jgi:hypothetical protein
MSYSGVKFAAKMIGTDLPTDSKLDKLKYWCQVFHDKNLAPPYEGGSFGNLSFRLKENENAFIITASESGLNESYTGDIFVTVPEVDLESGIVYGIGSKKPSSESMLHYAIYQARPDVEAIFHGHCKKISKYAKKLSIPITSREEPYGTVALVERVLESIQNHNFLEIKNHGFLTW